MISKIQTRAELAKRFSPELEIELDPEIREVFLQKKAMTDFDLVKNPQQMISLYKESFEEVIRKRKENQNCKTKN